MGSRSRRGCALLALTLAGVPACGDGPAGPDSPAVMTVEPPVTTTDSPVAVTVDGLPAGAKATVEAWTTDVRNRKWTSSARFTVDDEGRLSLAQPSEAGSYTGANAMGLLESLTIGGSDPDGEFRTAGDEYEVHLRVSVAGRTRAGAILRRQVVPPGVTTRELTVKDDGVFGEMYLPPDPAVTRPAVLLFSGGEGGLSTSTTAAALAARGYPALSVAYFAAPDVPEHLGRIPLEYFGRALGRLRDQKGVDRDRIVVMSQSRGGELALLLGSYYPDLVHAVVAGVPSSVALPGATSTDEPAWTWRGRAVPTYSSYQGSAPPVDAQGAIPVEKIDGPILMNCGGSDRVWSSCEFMDAVQARLRAQDFRFPVTALRYPDAGHFVGRFMAYRPCSQDCFDYLGGTAAANHAAMVDSQAELMSLLSSL